MQVLTTPRGVEKRDVYSILEIVNVDTGERTALKEFPDLIEAPNWTRDGGALVYNSLGRIYTFSLSDSSIGEIDTGYADRCNNDHVISSDGKTLAISHGTREDGHSRVYTLPFSGGWPALVTPIAPSYLHGISPDGKTLAYCGERNGQLDIYTIPVGGGVESRLTDAPGLDDGPEYSPCGKFIWFCSTRTGLMQVWRMDCDGKNQIQVTFDEDANSWFPHISPDGARIAYIVYQKGDVEPASHPANKNVEIRLMPSAGGVHKTIVKLFGGQGTVNVNSWAPDSKRLAFVSYRLK